MKALDRLSDLVCLNEHPIDIDKACPMTLASIYLAYQEEAKWLEQITPFIKDVSLTTKALQNVWARIKQLVHAYILTTKAPFLGAKEAWQEPDICIVLGTIAPLVEVRLDYALTIAGKFPSMPLILSGGGRQIMLEADFMYEYLCQKGIKPERLHKETDSLDTRGNAIFSKFLMRDLPLKENKNILLVTSDYHGPRSLNTFQLVFGSTFKLAVGIAPSQFEKEEFEKLVELEMACLMRFNKEVCNWHRVSPSGLSFYQSLEGDEESIFYQMLTQDSQSLYHTHWDLARKYFQL